MGYQTPTPIQEKSIPTLLDGRDLVAIAQTGTGKTASFGIPLVHRLLESKERVAPLHCRALILAPTRELASQVEVNIQLYAQGSELSSALIIGGVSKGPQVATLSKGVDLVVATPGRLLDLMETGDINLSQVEVLILDEADMMLDMGFHEAVMRISREIPKERQSVLFSATMPKAIELLAQGILSNPVKIEIAPESSTVDQVKQRVYFTLAENKIYALMSLLAAPSFDRVIIFCKAKYAVAEVVERLKVSGLAVGEIHSNRSQNERNQAIEDFSTGKIRVLVATDIASRGIDIDDVDLVINFDMPEDATFYVHRIGRTARAGREGVAISLCGEKDLPLLRNVQELIGLEIEPVLNHPFHHDFPEPKANNRRRGRKRPSQAKKRAKK